LMKYPSNLTGLLGYCFGAEVEPNNINSLACGFKSPRNDPFASSPDEKVSQWESFAASIFRSANSSSGTALLFAVSESKTGRALTSTAHRAQHVLGPARNCPIWT
jgi:hypothetical protein